MTKVIIASVIMASVTYGKCYLWQKYYVKCNYGKNIMANETEPSKPGSDPGQGESIGWGKHRWVTYKESGEYFFFKYMGVGIY